MDYTEPNRQNQHHGSPQGIGKQAEQASWSKKVSEMLLRQILNVNTVFGPIVWFLGLGSLVRRWCTQ